MSSTPPSLENLIRPEAMAAHVASRNPAPRSIRRSRATWGFATLFLAAVGLSVLASTIRITETTSGYAVRRGGSISAVLPIGVQSELRSGQEVRVSRSEAGARLQLTGEVVDADGAARLLGSNGSLHGQPAVIAGLTFAGDGPALTQPTEIQVQLRTRTLVEIFSLRRLLKTGSDG